MPCGTTPNVQSPKCRCPTAALLPQYIADDTRCRDHPYGFAVHVSVHVARDSLKYDISTSCHLQEASSTSSSMTHSSTLPIRRQATRRIWTTLIDITLTRPRCSCPTTRAPRPRLSCKSASLEKIDLFLGRARRSLDGLMASSTQDARTPNSNANPLMLLACSVDTPIHINRSHLLCVASRVLCGLGLRSHVHVVVVVMRVTPPT